MREHRQITKVRQQIKKYLPVGSRVVVACSGGADSLALADALLQLREEAGYRLIRLPCRAWGCAERKL